MEARRTETSGAWELTGLKNDPMEDLAASQPPSADCLDAPRAIDVPQSRFPYCIVWTPLPPLTWLLPFIGHMGIADSRGIIYDFAGPYIVGEDDMAFGKPTRYLKLDPSKVKGDSWDEAVRRASEIYCGRMHNICCDNCHSHVATSLDFMKYGGWAKWNMVILAFWIFFCGSNVSIGRFIYTWAPSVILYMLVLFAWLWT